MIRSLQTIFFGIAAVASLAAVAIFLNGCAPTASSSDISKDLDSKISYSTNINQES